ncbi:MAG: S8 family peptidase [archaeon]
MKKELLILSVLILVLSGVYAQERYIIETEKEIDLSLKDNVVGKITGSVKTSEKFVINTDKENLSKQKGLIRIEEDYKIKILTETPWNFQIIRINFSENENSGQGIKIAVLDTGADFDLLDVNSGYDFVNNDSDASDDNGHGTFVTQILKSPSENLPLSNAEIYAVKVINEYGEGYVSDAINGINWAINNNMNIILMSFGGPDYSEFFEEILDESYDLGILSIAATGNTGDQKIIFPAIFDSVISASSINQNYQLSSFSNFGASQELVAPGENILVTDGINQYLISGTSMSVPHVGVVATTYWSKYPEKTNKEIREILHETALDLGDLGKDNIFGYGLVRYSETLPETENLPEKIQELSSRINFLEDWKIIITETISNLITSITIHTTLINNHEERIQNLENSTTSQVNLTHPYFKYLSSNYRKKMVCGYAEENRLEHYEDLGYSCDLEYKISSSGRESVRCRCDRV